MLNNYELKTKESSHTLNSRIDAHKKHADKDITDWILQLVSPQPNESIIDVGCGNGNQALKYARCGSNVVGVDISTELLKEADTNAKKEHLDNAYFYQWDMNTYPEHGYKNFDKISSCFSIYYAKDIRATLSNLKKMLKPYGKLFIFTPTESNVNGFMELHWRINSLVPDNMALARTRRTRDEIIPALKELFKRIDVQRFDNKLTFHNVNDFMEYYLATPLYRDSVDGIKWKAELYKATMEYHVKNVIESTGKYEIQKESYGIIAGD